MTRIIPAAPKLEALPEKRRRAARASAERTEFDVAIKVVTPILGGAVTPRSLDEVDVIRAATVRGHLRFWWRALIGHRHDTSDSLYAKESALWGRAADDKGGRSALEVHVEMLVAAEPDPQEDVNLYGKDRTPGAYALWPARKQKANPREGKPGEPPAPRRLPGSQFRLHVCCPMEYEVEVRDAVRAWILFGGYGGRTRRGVGSLWVYEDPKPWLPAEPTRAALADLFGRDIFAPARKAQDLPLLAGAALHVGEPTISAERAWLTALGWLQDFRQGTSGASPAREPDPKGGSRPSISNWPEADKVRHLSERFRRHPWAHPPRHSDTTPAWPRAGFGLPIAGQFQRQSRVQRSDGKGTLRWDQLSSPREEPKDFHLLWRRDDHDYDRLASPLIVKALPLAGKEPFAPCALWLARAYPKGGEVALRKKDDPRSRRSGAPFDRLVAPGEEALFPPLRGKHSLREAFLTWLKASQKNITEVAP